MTTCQSISVSLTQTPSSFKLKSIPQALKTHETEKKRKNKKVCEEQRWHFIPFVCSVDGALGVDKQLGSSSVVLTI
jgi:hypothetical protein